MTHFFSSLEMCFRYPRSNGMLVDKLSANGDRRMHRCLLALAVIALLAPRLGRGQDVEQLLQQAMQASERGELDRAIAKLTDSITASPTTSRPWYLRGREHFRAGKIAESVADFDNFIELQPQAANQQWERGISLYYAGDFQKGAKQFEDYQKFQDS